MINWAKKEKKWRIAFSSDVCLAENKAGCVTQKIGVAGQRKGCVWPPIVGYANKIVHVPHGNFIPFLLDVVGICRHLLQVLPCIQNQKIHQPLQRTHWILKRFRHQAPFPQKWKKYKNQKVSPRIFFWNELHPIVKHVHIESYLGWERRCTLGLVGQRCCAEKIGQKNTAPGLRVYSTQILMRGMEADRVSKIQFRGCGRPLRIRPLSMKHRKAPNQNIDHGTILFVSGEQYATLDVFREQFSLPLAWWGDKRSVIWTAETGPNNSGRQVIWKGFN